MKTRPKHECAGVVHGPIGGLQLPIQRAAARTEGLDAEELQPLDVPSNSLEQFWHEWRDSSTPYTIDPSDSSTHPL